MMRDAMLVVAAAVSSFLFLSGARADEHCPPHAAQCPFLSKFYWDSAAALAIASGDAVAPPLYLKLSVVFVDRVNGDAIPQAEVENVVERGKELFGAEVGIHFPSPEYHYMSIPASIGNPIDYNNSTQATLLEGHIQSTFKNMDILSEQNLVMIYCPVINAGGWAAFPFARNSPATQDDQIRFFWVGSENGFLYNLYVFQHELGHSFGLADGDYLPDTSATPPLDAEIGAYIAQHGCLEAVRVARNYTGMCGAGNVTYSNFEPWLMMSYNRFSCPVGPKWSKQQLSFMRCVVNHYFMAPYGIGWRWDPVAGGDGSGSRDAMSAGAAHLAVADAAASRVLALGVPRRFNATTSDAAEHLRAHPDDRVLLLLPLGKALAVADGVGAATAHVAAGDVAALDAQYGVFASYQTTALTLSTDYYSGSSSEWRIEWRPITKGYYMLAVGLRQSTVPGETRPLLLLSEPFALVPQLCAAQRAGMRVTGVCRTHEACAGAGEGNARVSSEHCANAAFACCLPENVDVLQHDAFNDGESSGSAEEEGEKGYKLGFSVEMSGIPFAGAAVRLRVGRASAAPRPDSPAEYTVDDAHGQYVESIDLIRSDSGAVVSSPWPYGSAPSVLQQGTPLDFSVTIEPDASDGSGTYAFRLSGRFAVRVGGQWLYRGEWFTHEFTAPLAPCGGGGHTGGLGTCRRGSCATTAAAAGDEESGGGVCAPFLSDAYVCCGGDGAAALGAYRDEASGGAGDGGDNFFASGAGVAVLVAAVVCVLCALVLAVGVALALGARHRRQRQLPQSSAASSMHSRRVATSASSRGSFRETRRGGAAALQQRPSLSSRRVNSRPSVRHHRAARSPHNPLV